MAGAEQRAPEQRERDEEQGADLDEKLQPGVVEEGAPGLAGSSHGLAEVRGGSQPGAEEAHLREQAESDPVVVEALPEGRDLGAQERRLPAGGEGDGEQGDPHRGRGGSGPGEGAPSTRREGSAEHEQRARSRGEGEGRSGGGGGDEGGAEQERDAEGAPAVAARAQRRGQGHGQHQEEEPGEDVGVDEGRGGAPRGEERPPPLGRGQGVTHAAGVVRGLGPLEEGLRAGEQGEEQRHREQRAQQGRAQPLAEDELPQRQAGGHDREEIEAAEHTLRFEGEEAQQGQGKEQEQAEG